MPLHTGAQPHERKSVPEPPRRRRLTIKPLLAAILCLAFSSGFSAAAEPPKPQPNPLPFGVPNTIAVIRTAKINNLMTNIADIVVAFDPESADDAADEMHRMLDETFPGIDPDGPAAVLFIDDPNDKDEPQAVGLFHLADANAFQKKHEAEFAIVGDIGIVGEKQETVDAVAKALTTAKLKEIPTDGIQQGIVIDSNASFLITHYKKQIRELIADEKKQLQPNAGGKPAAPSKKDQAISKGLDYLAQLVDEVEKQGGPVRLGISFNRERIRSVLTLDAAARSDAARFLAKNSSPVDPALANLLPADAAQTAILKLDPKSIATLLGGMTRISADITTLSPGETDAIQTMFKNMSRHCNGQAAVAITPTQNGPTLVALLGLSDESGARSDLQTIAAFLKQHTCSVAYAEKSREHNGVPVGKLEVTRNLPAGIGPALKIDISSQYLPGLTPGADGRLSYEIVCINKMMIIANGPDCQNAMDKEIDLLKKNGDGGLGKTPEFAEARLHHPQKTVVFSTTSLFHNSDILNALMPFGRPSGELPTRAQLPPNEELASTSARVEKNSLIIETDIPVSSLVALTKAIEENRKAEHGPKKEKKGGINL